MIDIIMDIMIDIVIYTIVDIMIDIMIDIMVYIFHDWWILMMVSGESSVAQLPSCCPLMRRVSAGDARDLPSRSLPKNSWLNGCGQCLLAMLDLLSSSFCWTSHASPAWFSKLVQYGPMIHRILPSGRLTWGPSPIYRWMIQVDLPAGIWVSKPHNCSKGCLKCGTDQREVLQEAAWRAILGSFMLLFSTNINAVMGHR